MGVPYDMQESALMDHGSALAWMWRVNFNHNSTLRSLEEDYKQVILYQPDNVKRSYTNYQLNMTISA